jgi:hypothetical protein
VIEQDGTTSSEDEELLSQLYDLANSILEECKDATSLSDLDTAIYLFGEALDRRPIPHPHRSNTLKDTATALVTRFSLTKRREDLDKAMLLFCEVVKEWHDVSVRSILIVVLVLTIFIKGFSHRTRHAHHRLGRLRSVQFQ